MRTTSVFAALVASWTVTVAAAPAKTEGFIGSAHTSNSTGCKEVTILYEPDQPNPEVQHFIDMCNIDQSDIKRELHNPGFDALIACVSDDCAAAIKSMPEIALVEENVEVKTLVTQKTGSPWGLQRISNAAGASGDAQGQDFTYSVPSDTDTLGAGVDIYIVDTGMRTSHAVFENNRAQALFSFTGDNNVTDGDGHGTHVSGTAAGLKFGVAQGANLYAVKVLGDNGSGSSSAVIDGMDAVITNHNKRKSDPNFKGSVMSMSWGLQGVAATVDQVILAAIQQGIHVSVAAGNDGADACSNTPSHNGGSNSAVVSVGAINIQNEISTFSNTGSCVDVYAPGEQVLSSWNTGDNIINFLSGTSMACPHVSGVMAFLLADATDDSLKTDPAALKAKLLSMARQNAITGNANGGSSLLLSNGVDGGVAAKRLMKNWVVPGKDFTDEKRSPVGSLASRARDFVESLGKRWELHSTESQLRY